MATEPPPRTVPPLGATPLDSKEAAQRLYAEVPAPVRAALEAAHQGILARCGKSAARMEALRKLLEVAAAVKRAVQWRGDT